MDFLLILVFSELPVAIAHLWTDHQKSFKGPIKLLQSSGRRKTFLRRKHNSSFVSSTSQITSETPSKEPREEQTLMGQEG